MKNSYLWQQNKRVILIALAITVVLTVIGVWYYLYLQNRPTTSIGIRNYDQYVKNLPRSERTLIEETLYGTIEDNLQDITPAIVGDVFIRDNSYQQLYEDGIYTTSFIVDAEKIRQSYKVQSFYPEEGRNDPTIAYDYDVVVLCLAQEDLIYETFDCKDRSSTEYNLPKSDPVLSLLPYTTLGYSVDIGEFVDDKLELIIRLYLSDVDYRTGEAAVKASREAEIKQWLRDNSLNPDDYIFVYTDDGF